MRNIIQLKFIIIIVVFSICGHLKAQTYLYEGFESGILPAGWDEVVMKENQTWSYTRGGVKKTIDDVVYRFPSKAFSGNYNAMLQYPSSTSAISRLITPPVDLSASIKAELNFYRAQLEYGSNEFDFLNIYYRKSETDSWKLLDTNKLWQTPTEAWDTVNYYIPDSIYTSTFQLAFEGETNFGFGVCLDSIGIYERGVVPMQITNHMIEQTDQELAIAGTKDNPILKTKFDVAGNAGILTLDKVGVIMQVEDFSDIDSSGFSLYLTNLPYFGTSQKIGEINNNNNSDTIWFEGLNRTFSFGTYYLWFTANFSDTAKQGNIIDAYVPKDGFRFSLNISGEQQTPTFFQQGDSVVYIDETVNRKAPINAKFPILDVKPNGYMAVGDVVFYDGFEGENTWSMYGKLPWAEYSELIGDFEIAIPQGLGGVNNQAYGFPDPETAYRGAKVLGNDLTGDGNYYWETFNYAASPKIDLRYYKNAMVNFKYYLNVYNGHIAGIELSVGSDTAWQDIKNYPNHASYFWEEELINLNHYGIYRDTAFYFRFKLLNSSTDAYIKSGWNIDEFIVAGDFIEQDVGPVDLLMDSVQCIRPQGDLIKVAVKNLGYKKTVDNISVGVSFDDGDTYTWEVITASIDPDSVHIITFKDKNIYFEGAQKTILVKTTMEGDEDDENDQYSEVVVIQPNNNADYFKEEFIEQGGLWFPQGSDSSKWALDFSGKKNFPSGGGDGYKWITGNQALYNRSSMTYLESPCFDFSGKDNRIIEMSYYSQVADTDDGMNIEISLNEGKTWSVINRDSAEYNWEWHENNVNTLGDSGWNTNSEGWKVARKLLPDTLSAYQQIKFRLAFASDADAETDKGFAIESFTVANAPEDYGVSAIIMPEEACLNEVPKDLDIIVKNFGINPMYPGDSIPLGVIIDGDTVKVDTLFLQNKLNVNDTLHYKFKNILTFPFVKTYEIVAKTYGDKGFEYYQTTNDSSKVSFTTLALPELILPDTVRSYQLDSLYVKPTQETPVYKYTWTDGKIDIPYQVYSEGIYHVTITDTAGNGCKNYDSVKVELFYFDVGIDSILFPDSDCEFPDSITPLLRFKNCGNDTLKAGERVHVEVQLDGQVLVWDSIDIPQDMDAYTTFDFTFQKKFYIGDIGMHNFSAVAKFGVDTVHTNDTAFKLVETFGYSNLNLGNDTTVFDFGYHINIDTNLFTSYLWDNGNKESTRLIDKLGKYYVDVLDTNGCEASDTINVNVITYDIKVDSIISPSSACLAKQEISFSIKNEGNDTLTENTSIDVSMIIKGTEETKVLNIPSGEQVLPDSVYEFYNVWLFDPSTSGDFDFSITATRPGDLNKDNDTLSRILNIYPLPDIDLGNDTIVYDFEYTIAIDTGYAQYEWESPLDTMWWRTLTESGDYAIEVTDSNGCKTIDAIRIDLIAKDFKALSIEKPVSGCQLSVQDVKFTYKNSSKNYTFEVGDSVKVNIYIDNGFINEANAIFQENVEPGDEGTIELLGAFVPEVSGPISLKLECVVQEDLNTANNIVTKVTEINPSPDPMLQYTIGGSFLPLTQDTLYSTENILMNIPNSSYTAKWSHGITGNTVQISASGKYWVDVSDGSGCTTSDTIVITGLTAYERTWAEGELSYYPNPAGDFVKIKMPAHLNSARNFVSVYAIHGGLLINKEITSDNEEYYIDITDLKPGIYRIDINGEFGSIGNIFIKE
ncbi:T9SS type A sorting domain-containing protein [Bacteroidales bacterium]|nr:T9SS type A sorting domain-containing protein [Bacteroidales bacterium]